MSGGTEIGYEVGELNWCHRMKTNQMTLWELRTFIFLILFLCFRVLQSLFLLMRTIHEFLRQFFEHNVNIRVFTITIEASSESFSNLTPDPKNKWWFEEITRNPTMTFTPWLLYKAPRNEHRIHSLRFYSFIYDKRKHSLPSIFIDREAWIMASRNWEMLNSCWKMHLT